MKVDSEVGATPDIEITRQKQFIEENRQGIPSRRADFIARHTHLPKFIPPVNQNRGHIIRRKMLRDPRDGR